MPFGHWSGVIILIFFCLAETKLPLVSSILHALDFYRFVDCPSDGRKGGLLFSWKNGVDVEPVCVNHIIISLLVYSDPPNIPLLFLGVYGPTQGNQKPEFWQSLHRAASFFAGPWLCVGDFNCILAE